MAFIDLFYFLSIGLVAGFLAGLLGIGGGVIIVPCLYFVFKHMGFETSTIMHFCVATSLSTMIVTGLLSYLTHLKKKGFDWEVFKPFLLGITIGCIFGIITSQIIHPTLLPKIFGSFLVLLGIYLIVPHFPDLHFGRFTFAKKILTSSSIGFLSALLGIGGGIIAVPVFMGFQMPFKKAAALSSATTFVVALMGTLGYLLLSIDITTVIQPYTLGYIFIPAFMGISIGTSISSPIGVKYAYIFSRKLLTSIFAIVLIAAGISMLLH